MRAGTGGRGVGLDEEVNPLGEVPALVNAGLLFICGVGGLHRVGLKLAGSMAVIVSSGPGGAGSRCRLFHWRWVQAGLWLRACPSVVFSGADAAEAVQRRVGRGTERGAGGNPGGTLAAVGRVVPVVSSPPGKESAAGRPLLGWAVGGFSEVEPASMIIYGRPAAGLQVGDLRCRLGLGCLLF
jgi:hypothetical protein